MLTKEELLAKAKQPAADAMRLHPFYRGKVETALKCRVRDFNDFAIWYTPGVAAPCRAIQADPELVYQHTNKWNTVAVISDGTRVLGLGDIGPKAGLPVMEGKALLYKYLGGVDGVAVMLDTKDPDEIIRTVKILQPAFGGVNLEDISQPKCFRILDTLRAECEIPIWHDDQQGTATVTLAGLINALKVVRKKISDVKITFIGSGAANVAICRLIFSYGATPALCRVVDSKGILHKECKDLEQRRAEFVDKWKLCNITNAEGRTEGIPEALKDADVCIALSTPGPDMIKKEWVSQMAKDAIVFLCANPIPEMWPWDAKEAGAVVVATGRSDFPNQVNNSLGFPGIFRGTLDVRAKTITDEMCVAAAVAMAGMAEEKGLTPDYIMPTMDEWEVFPREAVAVAIKAQEQGIAQFTNRRGRIPPSLRHHQAVARPHHLDDERRLYSPIGIAPLLNRNNTGWRRRVQSVRRQLDSRLEETMCDLIIVGGGPAGLTAAAYAINKRIKMLVVSEDLGGKINYGLNLKGLQGYEVITGAEVNGEQ